MSPLQKKLLGVWKSDRRKTLQNFHRYHRLPAGKKKRNLAAVFGKMQLRYTGKYVHTKLRDFEIRERYEVIAEDTDSIVLKIYSDDLQKMNDMKACFPPEFFEPIIHVITFWEGQEQHYYWIGCGHFCEWFKKIQ